MPTRRGFLRAAGHAAVTSASFGSGAPAYAGPFTEADFDRLVPATVPNRDRWRR